MYSHLSYSQSKWTSSPILIALLGSLLKFCIPWSKVNSLRQDSVDRGQDRKFRPLPEPLRLQHSQDAPGENKTWQILAHRGQQPVRRCEFLHVFVLDLILNKRTCMWWVLTWRKILPGRYVTNCRTKRVKVTALHKMSRWTLQRVERMIVWFIMQKCVQDCKYQVVTLRYECVSLYVYVHMFLCLYP